MSKAIYEWQELPNGPKVAVAYLAESECAALSIYIPAGSRDEVGYPAGLAHFVEHMVFKGTERRSARDISFEIENAGGQLNASTSEDQTVYEGRGEADLMPLLIDILADMVWHPVFPNAEIDLEREVIGEEITMYKESPSDHIGDLISQALWGAHPLGNAISGSLESISEIDREKLVSFRDRHHFREDVVIAASGPFTLAQIVEMLTPHLPATFHAGEKPLPFDPATATPGNIVDARDTDQLQLSLAWYAPGRQSEKRHAMRLLSLMLGETASSRLFMELREERGLCYQISSDVTLFDEVGAFEINAGLDPDSRTEALECIYREIADLSKNGPREGELERAKRLAISQSKFAFETTGAHANWAGEGLLDYGHIPAVTDWRSKVLSVTHQEVQDIARELFDGKKPSIAEITPD